MRFADLDELLNCTCRGCERPFRCCECGARPLIHPSVPEDVAAAVVSSAWLGQEAWDLETARRVWARYRNAQDRQAL